MALADCPEEAEQAQKPEAQTAGAASAAGKKESRLRLVLLVLLAAAAGLAAACQAGIAQTAEAGRGWSHQVGHFGACDFDRYACCGQATHRICKLFTTVGMYCEDHWKSSGSKLFARLAQKRPEERTNEAAAKRYAQKVVERETLLDERCCAEGEMTAVYLEGGRWKVTGCVELQNGPGTVERQDWIVTLTLTDTGFRDYSVSFYDSEKEGRGP